MEHAIATIELGAIPDANTDTYGTPGMSVGHPVGTGVRS